MTENSNKGHTRISLHSVKNILGRQEQISLFSNHDEEFSGKIPDTYKNIKEIPVLKTTQSEIL